MSLYSHLGCEKLFSSSDIGNLQGVAWWSLVQPAISSLSLPDPGIMVDR